MNSITARQDNTTSGNDAWSGFEMWYYAPSVPAAVIFAIIFVALTTYHAILLFRRRTWFCIPFLVGGCFEIIGYIGRALAHNNTHSVPIFAMQSLCLLLAPILFAASIYMALGRIIRAVDGETYSFIRVNWMTKIFVAGDVFCFLIQSTGGGLLAGANTKSAIDLADNLTLGGLILQIVIFLFFLSAAIMFHMKMHKLPTAAALNGPLGEHAGLRGGLFGRLTWKKLMLSLYVTSVFITVRNLFRVVEYGMGWGSYLLTNEWSLYVFDGVLMILVLTIGITWYHPELSKGNKAVAATSQVHRLESGNSTMRGQHDHHLLKNQHDEIRPWS